MAKVNLTLPNLGVDELSDSQVIRKIASYLYIQNEQLRYELTHIDEDNMSSESGAAVQGITKTELRKAIDEAMRDKDTPIDLTDNVTIKQIEKRLDNLKKQLAQDESAITRLTEEVNKKVNLSTYQAGISNVNALIAGLQTQVTNNTTQIGVAIQNAAAAQDTANSAASKAATAISRLDGLARVVSTQSLSATSATIGGHGTSWVRVEATNGIFYVLGTYDM